MKPLTRLKKISAAVMLLSATQAAHAFVPWNAGATQNNVDPNTAHIIYISGGAAQDLAFGKVVYDKLAQPNTLDVFGDSKSGASPATDFGSRWTVYYFKGTAASGYLDQPVIIVKRSLGAAGYGVIPVAAASDPGTGQPLKLEELDLTKSVFTGATIPAIVVTPGAGTSGTINGVPGNTVGNWQVNISSAATAATVLSQVQSHAGILGVDGKLLLKPGTKNYPLTVPVVATGTSVQEQFPSGGSALTALPNWVTALDTGGLVYGIGVTTDLYNVLQAAQVIAGQLPATTEIGNYSNEAWIPSLSANFVGSLIAGKIPTWNVVNVVDKTSGLPVSLTSLAVRQKAAEAYANGYLPSDFSAAGGKPYSYTGSPAAVPLPNQVGGKTPVAIAIRNAGAAIGAIAYADYLNYPWTNGSFAPKNGTSTLAASSATPYSAANSSTVEPDGANATGRVLDDWQKGTNNVSTFAFPATWRRWGLAVHDATRNASGNTDPKLNTPENAGKQFWRYVRIDGYLPSIKNIASGGYKHWGEGQLLIDGRVVAVGAGDPNETLLRAIASGLSDPAIGAYVNSTIVHTWGQTGIFGIANGTTKYADIPFNPNNPVVNYTHTNGSNLNEIVPVIGNATAVNGSEPAGYVNGVLLQGLPQSP